MMQTWIEQHPNATKLDKMVAYAKKLIGTTPIDNPTLKKWFGLDAEWCINNESPELRAVFDLTVIRCMDCDKWYDPATIYDNGCCEGCYFANIELECCIFEEL